MFFFNDVHRLYSGYNLVERKNSPLHTHSTRRRRRFAYESIHSRMMEITCREWVLILPSRCSRFMILSEQSSQNQFSDSFLRDACTNFILAGRDTSSVALSWFFWLLTWHPHVEAKCLEEITRILGARSGGTPKETCYRLCNEVLSSVLYPLRLVKIDGSV